MRRFEGHQQGETKRDNPVFTESAAVKVSYVWSRLSTPSRHNRAIKQSPRRDLRRCMSPAFYLSIEFQQTGYLVERLYKSAYGDATGTSTINGSHQLSYLNGSSTSGRSAMAVQSCCEAQSVQTNDQQAHRSFQDRHATVLSQRRSK
jgi:hypothetical protein